ncbi:DUF6988 family protein [Pseudomonas sp. NPDC089530]|uniref:DUF6988 family protein n=1 Tax=Pseudomonas sp. NPDC089530 TaxID=3390651 RepID=UPI003D0412FA
MANVTDEELEERAYRLLLRTLEWTLAKVVGKVVDKSSLRQHLAGHSFHLAIDLIGGVRTLVLEKQRSASFVLMRSIVENSLRGFWFSYVATDEQIKQYSVGRMTNTTKAIAAEIQKKGFEKDCKFALSHPVFTHLDQLTHGGVEHLALRDEESASRKIGPVQLSGLMLILCSSYLIFLVDYILRVVHEDLVGADFAYKEGCELYHLD